MLFLKKNSSEAGGVFLLKESTLAQLPKEPAPALLHSDSLSGAGFFASRAAVALVRIYKHGDVFRVELETLLRTFVYTYAAARALLAIDYRMFRQISSPSFPKK